MAKEKIKTWTRFMDMHSGGRCKESPYEKIYIEAPEEQARIIFYNKFGHNPDRVTCTCCGSDYSYDDYSSFAEASAYDRNCKYVKDKGYVEEPRESSYTTYELVKIDDYKANENVLVITKSEIEDVWRKGEVPEEGYVWM